MVMQMEWLLVVLQLEGQPLEGQPLKGLLVAEQLPVDQHQE